MKAKFFFIFTVFVVHCSFSQWSTSTKAESALYVCPGFNQGILTFDDGSSIICGALSDSRYVQKLDPYGYKMWQQPVQVYNTPGTNNTGNALSMVTDGDGGVILWWADFRGAEVGQFGAYNNSMYMQKVDKNGQIKWQSGGVQIAPLAGGGKGGWGVADGEGGIILHMDEIDFLRPQAAQRAVTWIVRYNTNGQEMWRHELDTSTVEFQLTASQPVKLGSRVMISTLKGLKFFEPIAGDALPTPPFVPNGKFILERDSTAFNIQQLADQYDSTGIWVYKIFKITKINNNWDSLWSHVIKYRLKKNVVMPFQFSKMNISNTDIVQTDQLGGLFHCYVYTDTSGYEGFAVRRVDRKGVHFQNDEVKIRAKFGQFYGFNGKGEFGIINIGTIGQKIDTAGNKLWHNNDTLSLNMSEAYSPLFANDNNGGGIFVFWTIMGGIYALHTGRTGEVGVITKIIIGKNVSPNFELSQNYPNPFNPITIIPFSIKKIENVELTIYDVLGRVVTTLVRERLSQGRYTVRWDAHGHASGIYYYRLQINNSALVKKMILLH